MTLGENICISNDELTEFHEYATTRVRGDDMVHYSGSCWDSFAVAPLRVRFKVLFVLDLVEYFCAVANFPVVFCLTTVHLTDIVDLVRMCKVICR
jgi:hypothetical protein